ncbi:ChaN family lipoprotein [Desulforhopalus singaporensis]|uniref:Uncharacterized iron-regulated protein n=1 Tax=Desulforhopalus singaporensis TaxID=91360 RepID=A0A1H0J7X7_9BACT|nr:ChaN family lipoprotein [Desulforhopalus singaporensis]SDO39431.1 Uncharacterized iron-regulated protein [Desulforhopalus singaporensis]
MIRFPQFVQYAAALFLLLTVCTLSQAQPVIPEAAILNYDLAISFQLREHLMTGTARITIPPGNGLALSLTGLEVTGTLLQQSNGREQTVNSGGDVLILPEDPNDRTLFISYRKKISQHGQENYIEPDAISLLSAWYPVPQTPVLFSLSAEVPDGFEAITESDSFPLQKIGNRFRASYSNPTTTIHFIAGPYTLASRTVRPGLDVYTMFFSEDQALSLRYLEQAAEFLAGYEQKLGQYPFSHYVIVANRLPTGYGMPTFTLLGQTVLRLPFIVTTSLGHEIVHSWFGNGVQVDGATGNWCEGLTSYLSDYSFREQQGEGRSSRKENIVKYLSYTDTEETIPLADFVSADHNQPLAQNRRAVGYNRGVLFFHELREKITTASFTDGLRLFYKNYNGKSASWQDLMHSFAAAGGKNLQRFFDERLNRTSIPELAVENIGVERSGTNITLTFDIRQLTDDPFVLRVPVRVTTLSATVTKVIETGAAKQTVNIELDDTPLTLEVDPDYTFLRRLSDNEYPAVLSRFLGAADKLIVTTAGEEEKYQPILSLFANEDTIVVSADEVRNKDLGSRSLLLLGVDQLPVTTLFGTVHRPAAGVTVDVRHHPLVPGKTAVLLSSSSRQESAAVARRLKHYGKYSFLHFSDGRKTKAETERTENGIVIPVTELPDGGATKEISGFDGVVDKLMENRVIYVGEQHTSLSDHLLQLRLIEAIHAKHDDLAIGMEMFPVTSQDALDSYILAQDSIDEAAFLRQSDYFNVWRFDYRYYRDIINFAKKNKVPVIGINLDRQIVSGVFRDGDTDGLDPQVLASLPKTRDLDIAGYRQRLEAIHNIHQSGGHGSGFFSGFIQAQGLWDETMASNISNYLKQNPTTRIIVLAGAQHTRKDSGIPPRVARRLSVQQASVVNISGDSFGAFAPGLADYFFISEAAQLPQLPKIGVVLVSEENDQMVLKVDSVLGGSGAEHAGLKKNDILIELDGRQIHDMIDVKAAMLDKDGGETVAITVLRSSREIKFNVELRPELPARPAGHP